MTTEKEMEPSARERSGINAFLYHRKKMVNSRFTENLKQNIKTHLWNVARAVCELREGVSGEADPRRMGTIYADMHEGLADFLTFEARIKCMRIWRVTENANTLVAMNDNRLILDKWFVP